MSERVKGVSAIVKESGHGAVPPYLHTERNRLWATSIIDMFRRHHEVLCSLSCFQTVAGWVEGSWVSVCCGRDSLYYNSNDSNPTRPERTGLWAV